MLFLFWVEWKFTNWGPCSKSGSRYRAVYCSTGKEDDCKSLTKPSYAESCSNNSSTRFFYIYLWILFYRFSTVYRGEILILVENCNWKLRSRRKIKILENCTFNKNWNLIELSETAFMFLTIKKKLQTSALILCENYHTLLLSRNHHTLIVNGNHQTIILGTKRTLLLEGTNHILTRRKHRVLVLCGNYHTIPLGGNHLRPSYYIP